MSVRIKDKIYKTVARPAMLYKAETILLTKSQEEKINVAKIQMLRWPCGVQRVDRIRKETIRGTIGAERTFKNECFIGMW